MHLQTTVPVSEIRYVRKLFLSGPETVQKMFTSYFHILRMYPHVH